MSESTSPWLTVAECAAALGISERQARRYAGRLAPDDRREPDTEAGHQAGRMTGVLVRVEAMATEREKATGRTQTAQSPLRPDATPDYGPDVEPDAQQVEAGHQAGRDDQPTPDVKPDAQSTLTAHLLEENRFLRAALEARDRDAAELRAALREALKISNRALVESTSDVAVQADSTTKNGPPMEVSGQAGNTPQHGSEREETARQSTFERQQGFRAWLLKILRG